MAPIDLPPEPSLSKLSTVSISTVAPKAKEYQQQAHHLSAQHHSTPGVFLDSSLEPTFSPRSIIPNEQFATGFSDDLSKPNLAQLPSLPLETDTELPTEDTLDTVDEAVNDALESESIENIDQTDIEDIQSPLENNDLDVIDGDNVDLDDLNLDIDDDLDDLGEFETDDVELEQESEALEDIDLVPDESIDASEDSETPFSASPEALDPSKLEITADTQVFDATRQVVIARGNVVFKLNNAFLLADEMWINLVNRYVLAEGNVILTRGEQQVRGERAEYNLLQEAGTIFETRGELFLPELEDDFADPLEGPATSRTVFDPLNPDEEVTNVRSTGGVQVSSDLRSNRPDSFPEIKGGGIRRLRFEAARVQFDAETWVAEEVRLTNDPFSPPELEYRTDRMTLVTLSPTADLLTTSRPRLVFDQGLSLPLLKSRYVLNRGAADSSQIDPFLIYIGIDSRDRGGLFLENEFPIIRNETTNLSITPQYFLERASNQGLTDEDVFGVEVDFDTRFSRRSEFSARAALTSFNFDQIEDNLRANVRHRYLIRRHRLTTEYSYRDRFFNGSLGFQDVRSSFGTVLQSPQINLDNRGLIWTYQVGGQLITARTDRTDLLGRPRRGGDEDLITLGRMQASTRLAKRFSLWRGKSLPATKDEGLRYTPVPLVPFLSLNVSLLGITSYYTSGDLPTQLSGDVRLDGQLGHLSRDFFDYTRFNIGYSEDIVSDNRSPFLFDRDVDRRVLSFGVLQQIFGPILLGFQTSFNINTRERINTDIIFQYSRRTYGFVARYSPSRETGSIGFRLSDFNWLGSGSPFDEPNIRQVDNSLAEER